MKESILLGLSLAAPIGPINIEIIRRGLKNRKEAVLTSFGAILAEITRLFLVFIGLHHFLDNWMAKFILWVFGFAVLAYLGLSTIRGYFNNNKPCFSEKSFRGNSVLAGYLLTISNPLGIVFWVGIYGSVLASSSLSNKLAGLTMGFWILTGITIWLIILNTLIHFGKKFINQKVFRYISLAGGLILLFFALKFVYQASLLLVQLMPFG